MAMQVSARPSSIEAASGDKLKIGDRAGNELRAVGPAPRLAIGKRHLFPKVRACGYGPPMNIDDLSKDEQDALRTVWRAAPMHVPGTELNGLGRKLLLAGWLSRRPIGLRGEVFQLASDEVRWLVARRWPEDRPK